MNLRQCWHTEISALWQPTLRTGTEESLETYKYSSEVQKYIILASPSMLVGNTRCPRSAEGGNDPTDHSHCTEWYPSKKN